MKPTAKISDFFSYHVFSSTGGSESFTEFENLYPFSSYDTSKLGHTCSFWAKLGQNSGKNIIFKSLKWK